MWLTRAAGTPPKSTYRKGEGAGKNTQKNEGQEDDCIDYNALASYVHENRFLILFSCLLLLRGQQSIVFTALKNGLKPNSRQCISGRCLD